MAKRSDKRSSDRTQRTFSGVPAAPGIVIGPAFVHIADSLTAEPIKIPASGVDNEIERFLKAVERTKLQIHEVRGQVNEEIDDTHAAIFDSHLRVLEDPLLIDATVEEIRRERLNAEYIFNRNVQRIGALLAKIKDQSIAGRDIDLVDVGQGVARNLQGKIRDRLATMGHDMVVCARELSPSDTAQMGKTNVLGFVCATGGPTSHTAILAKALDLPAVLGVGDEVNQIAPGDLLIVDGSEGKVVINPRAETLTKYRKARTQSVRRRRRMGKLRDLAPETKDGFQIKLATNIELPMEIDLVAESGATGVGLFRTEFLFLERDEMPTEEEQAKVYTRAARELKPDPVIFRTIDLGGDKFLSITDLGKEINPFLGLRAIRLCLDNRDLFMTQLRAILRASARGKVSIMFPLVSDVQEVREAKILVKQAREELLSEGVPIADHVPVGIMVETPSAAITADVLAREVDFFSIGTNDLIQYTLAVDRVNERVAHLYQPLHPSVLRLMRTVVDAAHREGIWCGVCGEMAADETMTPVLLGMGIDELSMSSVAVPRVKKAIRDLKLNECQQLFDKLVKKSTVTEVQSALKRHFRKRERRTAPRRS